MTLTDATSSLCLSLELRGEPVISGGLRGGTVSLEVGCHGVLSSAARRDTGVLLGCARAGAFLFILVRPSLRPLQGTSRLSTSVRGSPARGGTVRLSCCGSHGRQNLLLSRPDDSSPRRVALAPQCLVRRLPRRPHQRPGPARRVPEPGGGCAAQSGHHEPRNPRQALGSCETAGGEEGAGTVQAAECRGPVGVPSAAPRWPCGFLASLAQTQPHPDFSRRGGSSHGSLRLRWHGPGRSRSCWAGGPRGDFLACSARDRVNCARRRPCCSVHSVVPGARPRTAQVPARRSGVGRLHASESVLSVPPSVRPVLGLPCSPSAAQLSPPALEPQRLSQRGLGLPPRLCPVPPPSTLCPAFRNFLQFLR